MNRQIQKPACGTLGAGHFGFGTYFLHMWRFTLLGFPVVVHWQFWLTTALLGSSLSANRLILWVGIVFVSILGHELGHALAMRHFGDRAASISLYAFGGLAQGRYWRSRNQQIVISAAGPAFSAALGLLGWLVAAILHPESQFAFVALQFWLWVNIGWTLFNLLPVIPLDGGRISEALFGPARARQACQLSMVVAIVAAVAGLLDGSLWMALMFGMMAYSNWQQMNGRTPPNLMRP